MEWTPVERLSLHLCVLAPAPLTANVMPSPSESARVERPVRSLTLPAFVCGICSGPVAFGLAMLTGQNHLPEQTKELLALISLATVLGGAFVFACIARLTLSPEASVGSRRLTNIAIAAPLAWAATIAAFIAYALTQV